MERIFKKVEERLESAFGGGDDEEKHSHSHNNEQCDNLHSSSYTNNRFHSFAPESNGNVKWYVDGCSYFWAVSEALEREFYHISVI